MKPIRESARLDWEGKGMSDDTKSPRDASSGEGEEELITLQDIKNNLWTGAYQEKPTGYGMSVSSERSADRDVEFLIHRIDFLHLEIDRLKEKNKMLLANSRSTVFLMNENAFLDGEMTKLKAQNEKMREALERTLRMFRFFGEKGHATISDIKETLEAIEAVKEALKGE